MSRVKLNSLISSVVIAVIMGSCGEKNKTGNITTEAEVLPDDVVEMRFDQIKLAGIDTGSVQLRSLSGTIKAGGKVTVAPQNYATVSAPLGGFVKTTNLLPGYSVRKGQYLAEIENQDFVDLQENYLETKSRLEYAEAEYKRHSELFNEDVYSEKNLQQVTADYKSLKAHVTALEQKLSIIGVNPSDVREDNIVRSVQLVSPISGYIKSVNINIGKSVSPEDVLFEIVNTDNLLLELTLFEKDAGKLSKGQNIIFLINNETEEHTAIITQTGRSVDADKAYKVYASVLKGCENLMPGMYVNAVIELPGNKVASISSEAVVSFDDKDYIFVFDRNKEEQGNPFTEYKIIEVRRGITDGTFTEIGLPDNFDIKKSKVVIKGAYNLLSAKKNAGEMAC